MNKLDKIFKNKKKYEFDPYFIAEAGVNHGGKLDKAFRLIEEAKEGGADAIKFQTYKANTIASKHSPSYWDLKQEKTRSQYLLFKKYDSFSKKDYEKLKKHCDKFKIDFLSTPFDLDAANFLNDLVDCFKISSSDLNNIPFIEHISSFGKPIILSTGASNINEIKKAVSVIEKNKNKLGLLHCVLNYPTQIKNANLLMIRGLKKNFNKHLIGYSDHTLVRERDVLISSVLLGAQIIEKHFTYNNKLKGNDHYHSLDKKDLKQIITRINDLKLSLGKEEKSSLKSEKISRKNARRSLVASKNIELNEVISLDKVTWKRPGNGISPDKIKSIIGKKAKRKIKEDSIFKFSDFQ